MAYTVVDKGSKYFNTVTYAGAGGTQAVSGLDFTPDFVWIKNRSITADHMLYDVVRGTGSSKALTSDDVDPEGLGTNVGLPSQYGYLSAFNSDGFTVVAGSSNGNFVNTSGNNFVSWNWDANGAGVSNTAGTITSTVSANTTAGFSIVTYTGNSSSSATVGHGLGVAPSMILNKCRTGANAAQRFFIYHKGLSANNMISFNGNAQAGTGTYSSGILSTSPTSTTFGFTAGSGGVINVNESSSTYVSYCFAEVKGFSKFGSYTGNGSTDGTFLYTGFSPAFIMFKNITTSNRHWYMMDNKRNTYNVANIVLTANFANDESWWGTGNNIDFLSNGIKIRSNSDINNSGDTFIYMAFASNPFVSSKGIPTTAR
jgi:hypothetical protein